MMELMKFLQSNDGGSHRVASSFWNSSLTALVKIHDDLGSEQLLFSVDDEYLADGR